VAAETGVQPTEQGHAFEWAAGDAWAPLPCTYRRRDPEGTVLHHVVRENLSTFLAEAEAHRGLPRHVEQDFLQYLSCGVLAQGFSRVRCESCGDEVLVAFSCAYFGHRDHPDRTIVITQIGHRDRSAATLGVLGFTPWSTPPSPCGGSRPLASAGAHCGGSGRKWHPPCGMCQQV
jgi:hypothetical protein